MTDKGKHKHSNRLIDETSPYLLQHAHNPVDWYPWGREALDKAREEDKMLLISVGYSACHWCHVMEKESFEDSSVAKIMNENFVCIKVDREERPDIDQVYMTAVQLMTQRGGWPLNCFALPDGRPVYGGTYFPKDQWIQILNALKEEYVSNRPKFEEYAEKLTEGIQQSDLIPVNLEEAEFEQNHLADMVDKWKASFDRKEGGTNNAPKFPLPNNWQFLLRYAHLTENLDLLGHVELTLDKMAAGGIYDQLGGGFARYSTDVLWKVPHFEKMLYDNAQLLELYTEGYQKFGKARYKEIVYETVAFIERELRSRNGAFYSALDADSDGEEGKFYVWTEEEINSILKDDADEFKSYYRIGKKAKWEHGSNILLTEVISQTPKGIQDLKERLLIHRRDRVRPGLDDKSLTSWNALLLKSLIKAYRVFDEERFKLLAIQNASFILREQLRTDGGLNHSFKAGVSKINGYLEDYAFTVEAFLEIYQSTFDQVWIDRSKDLVDYTIEHFYDDRSGLFYFTSSEDDPLVARQMEINDNVTPSPNSSMAKSLFILGTLLENKSYLKMSEKMLNNIKPQMTSYASGYSNWGQLYLFQSFPVYEVAVVGENALEKVKALSKIYRPNKIYLGSKTEGQLPLLDQKYVAGETMIYVCVQKACQMPTSDVTTALNQIQ